ncbi:MAG: metallophosphoesterase, partial [Halobacteriaceae archaeon]
HDQLSISEFESRYTPDGLPFRIEFGDISVFGLNSSGSKKHLFDSHDGEVPPDQLTWLKEELPSAANPIILVHHNLPEMSNQLKDHRDAVESDMEIPPI